MKTDVPQATMKGFSYVKSHILACLVGLYCWDVSMYSAEVFDISPLWYLGATTSLFVVLIGLEEVGRYTVSDYDCILALSCLSSLQLFIAIFFPNILETS